MSSNLGIQHFPCVRNLANFATEGDPDNTVEKTCRIGASFFLAIPALIADVLLYLPLEAYNSSIYPDSEQQIPTPFARIPSHPISTEAHLQQAIDFALSTWPDKQTEVREAIQDGMVDEWNVFQMTAEWSIAQYLENSFTNRALPPYLMECKPLSNGMTLPKLAVAFQALKASDRKDLINAIRQQKEGYHTFFDSRPDVQSVLRNLRAFASEMQQGHPTFFHALRNYQPPVAPVYAPSPYAPRPIASPPYTPPQPVYVRRPAAPTYPRPSAPPLYTPPQPVYVGPHAPFLPNLRVVESPEVRMALDVAFLRNAVKQAARTQGGNQMNYLRTRICKASDAFAAEGYIARYAVLHFLKEMFRNPSHPRTPAFFSLDKNPYGAPSLRVLGQQIAAMSQAELDRLEIALNPDVNMQQNILSYHIRQHELMLRQDPQFKRAAEALKIDLLAD